MEQPRPTFVVAIEYLGADVAWRRGIPREPLYERAYDVRAPALTAHSAHPLRVGFPDHQRGWASTPCAPRCRECTEHVDAVVAAVVT